jgi:hypothetical protein
MEQKMRKQGIMKGNESQTTTPKSLTSTTLQTDYQLFIKLNFCLFWALIRKIKPL